MPISQRLASNEAPLPGQGSDSPWGAEDPDPGGGQVEELNAGNPHPGSKRGVEPKPKPLDVENAKRSNKIKLKKPGYNRWFCVLGGVFRLLGANFAASSFQ